DRPTFVGMRERGEVLESAEYYGQLYGTARPFVEGCLESGERILEIGAQGGRAVKRTRPEGVPLFILPPSFQELERRLKVRSQESEEAIRRRLEIAKGEIVFYRDYDYIIINDVLESSIVLLESIVRTRAVVPERQEHRINEIIASFGGTA